MLLLLAASPGIAGPAEPGSAEARATALIAKMSREEKISQLIDVAPAIPRLGIPAYQWWNEGLHGIARNGHATVFPQAIGLAATWNPDLLQQVGSVVSTEARAKFNLAGGPGKDHRRYEGLTIWSPNVNIFRDPRWGRGMETYGEDPTLTAALAVAFVRGLQGDDPGHPRAIATPKHFAVHSGPEPGRHGFSVAVSPHDLEATYLPAFRAAVVEGRAGSVMCAYNALHGTPACAAEWLLDGRLRRDWGFTGFVVSDCGAISDITGYHYYRPDDAASAAAALQAGNDLSCGSAYGKLGIALQRGDVDEALIDQALVRLFAARYRLGELDPQRPDPYAALGETDIGSKAHRDLALQAAVQSMVLLKNANGTLPLAPGKRVAVIGPNADALAVLEANYQGTARDPVTPLRGLRERFGADKVAYAQGSNLAEGVPTTIPETALRHGDALGLKGEYFANPELRGKPALVRQDSTVGFNWDRVAPDESLPKDGYSVRWSGELLPPAPGEYTLAVRMARCFDCRGHDPVRLYIDDKLILAGDARAERSAGQVAPGTGTRALEATLRFEDAAPRRIRLELEHRGDDQGLRLEWIAPVQAQLAEAERAVARSDAVLAFVGLSPDVEGEALQIDVAGFDGGDRNDIRLPAPQRALLERAKASGKPLVVVLMSGSAVALTWAQQHADAILAAWYPGESGGTAIARVLAGDDSPGGRLPVTFYRSTADLPPYVSYDMRGYGKGRTYRYFEGDPLYPFGHGLSYTRFDYAPPTLSTRRLPAGETLHVGVRVRNAGTRRGDEVVQAYLEYPQRPLSPRRALVGFQRIALQPGESRELTFELDARALSDVDRGGKRMVRAGDYRVFVGGGQPGTGAPGDAAVFAIEGEVVLPR